MASSHTGLDLSPLCLELRREPGVWPVAAGALCVAAQEILAGGDRVPLTGRSYADKEGVCGHLLHKPMCGNDGRRLGPSRRVVQEGLIPQWAEALPHLKSQPQRATAMERFSEKTMHKKSR